MTTTPITIEIADHDLVLEVVSTGPSGSSSTIVNTDGLPGPTTIFVGATPPTNPVPGDIWIA